MQLLFPALPGFEWVLEIFFPAEGMVIAEERTFSARLGRGGALGRLSRCKIELSKIELSMRDCWESKIHGG